LPFELEPLLDKARVEDAKLERGRAPLAHVPHLQILSARVMESSVLELELSCSRDCWFLNLVHDLLNGFSLNGFFPRFYQDATDFLHGFLRPDVRWPY
jgi:hypothetical protein